jgi:hypothetical protein
MFRPRGHHQKDIYSINMNGDLFTMLPLASGTHVQTLSLSLQLCYNIECPWSTDTHSNDITSDHNMQEGR